MGMSMSKQHWIPFQIRPRIRSSNAIIELLVSLDILHESDLTIRYASPKQLADLVARGDELDLFTPTFHRSLAPLEIVWTANLAGHLEEVERHVAYIHSIALFRRMECAATLGVTSCLRNGILEFGARIEPDDGGHQSLVWFEKFTKGLFEDHIPLAASLHNLYLDLGVPHRVCDEITARALWLALKPGLANAAVFEWPVIVWVKGGSSYANAAIYTPLPSVGSEEGADGAWIIFQSINDLLNYPQLPSTYHFYSNPQQSSSNTQAELGGNMRGEMVSDNRSGMEIDEGGDKESDKKSGKKRIKKCDDTPAKKRNKKSDDTPSKKRTKKSDDTPTKTRRVKPRETI